MRTLSEILRSASLNEPTTHNECEYAMLALNALGIMDHSDLRRIASKQSENSSAFQRYSESCRRNKIALAKSPKEWIGWNDDPLNPDCVKRKRAARKLFEKITEQGDK